MDLELFPATDLVDPGVYVAPIDAPVVDGIVDETGTRLVIPTEYVKVAATVDPEVRTTVERAYLGVEFADPADLPGEWFRLLMIDERDEPNGRVWYGQHMPRAHVVPGMGTVEGWRDPQARTALRTFYAGPGLSRQLLQAFGGQA